MAFSKSCVVVVTVLQIPVNLIEVCAWDSPREIRQGEERESGCLIFEHEIEAVRGFFFLAENRVPNPLI